MKPIPVSEFSGHVERLHADRDKLFEMEYEVSAYTIAIIIIVSTIWCVCGGCIYEYVCMHVFRSVNHDKLFGG